MNGCYDWGKGLNNSQSRTTYRNVCTKERAQRKAFAPYLAVDIKLRKKRLKQTTLVKIAFCGLGIWFSLLVVGYLWTSSNNEQRTLFFPLLEPNYKVSEQAYNSLLGESNNFQSNDITSSPLQGSTLHPQSLYDAPQNTESMSNFEASSLLEKRKAFDQNRAVLQDLRMHNVYRSLQRPEVTDPVELPIVGVE